MLEEGRFMKKSLQFYRDKLGFKTDETGDNPDVVIFSTPGTKLELYPLDLLVKDIDLHNPPAPEGERLPAMPPCGGPVSIRQENRSLPAVPLFRQFIGFRKDGPFRGRFQWHSHPFPSPEQGA